MASSDPPIPLLALPAGSILQFLFMTFPLLAVYIFFLYLAVTRPSVADPDNPNYSQEAFMQDRIRLTDILYTYLATLVLFASLVVYLLWFVRKRRKLSKRYETEAITILGDVEYDASSGHNGFCAPLLFWIKNGCRRNDYGYVIYDLAKVANHPACNYEERKRLKGFFRKNKPLEGKIRKRVRVYYHYPREQISVMVLPEFPFSGQPKVDLEADWASFSESVGYPSEEEEGVEAGLCGGACGGSVDGNKPKITQPLSRDRSIGVLIISTLWISFCFFSALYTCFQISIIEQYYTDEDATWAWGVFWVTVGAILPLVAGGGNYLRWKSYEHWILRRGKRLSDIKTNIDRVDEDDGGDYIQMT